MIFSKFRNHSASFHLSLRAKITLSLSAIAISLLVSCTISILEYSRMSDYVSGLIADNIKSITIARKLSEVCNVINLDILTAIGDDNIGVPDYDTDVFVDQYNMLKDYSADELISPLADSVMLAFTDYIDIARELNDVMMSDFIDSRGWYFGRLQPQYNHLVDCIDALTDGMYNVLSANSLTFQRGFYRSIIPGFVAVCVGLLLIMMLLFFIMVYYVNPIYRMLDSLKKYRVYNKRYSYDFEGDDQLSELNAGIAEIAAENQQLRQRLNALKVKSEV